MFAEMQKQYYTQGASSLFIPEKGMEINMEEKEYSVSEAVRLTGVPSHVLRYWEEELQISIRRTSQGHRIYSGENLELFRQVKELKDKGIQLKAIRVLLDETEERDEELAGQIREIAQSGKEETEGNAGTGKTADNSGMEERQECAGMKSAAESSGTDASSEHSKTVRKSAAGSSGTDVSSEHSKTVRKSAAGSSGTDASSEYSEMGMESEEEENGTENFENPGWNQQDAAQELACEIVLPEERPDNLKQFEAILKRMMEEVVAEQNEKLEQAIAAMIREEIEDLYVQYYQSTMQEAAASRQEKNRRGGLLEWLRQLGRRNE